jgi:hypothetical protein
LYLHCCLQRLAAADTESRTGVDGARDEKNRNLQGRRTRSASRALAAGQETKPFSRRCLRAGNAESATICKRAAALLGLRRRGASATLPRRHDSWP